MTGLTALLALAAAAWFWGDSLRAREIVLARCKNVCAQLDLQLLDQTVTISGLGVGRGPGGGLRLRRTYGFEFSIAGVDRYTGQATLIGHRIEMVRLDYPDGAVYVDPSATVTHGPWRLPP